MIGASENNRGCHSGDANRLLRSPLCRCSTTRVSPLNTSRTHHVTNSRAETIKGPRSGTRSRRPNRTAPKPSGHPLVVAINHSCFFCLAPHLRMSRSGRLGENQRRCRSDSAQESIFRSRSPRIISSGLRPRPTIGCPIGC